MKGTVFLLFDQPYTIEYNLCGGKNVATFSHAINDSNYSEIWIAINVTGK